jgi:hypothetical protein
VKIIKTTIEIPDSTFRRAKTLAAARGITFKQLFTEALEDKLRRTALPRKTHEPPWMKGFGALGKTPAMRAETRRIQRLIDQEFERVEPEYPE